MYQCDLCNLVVAPNISCNLVAIKSRTMSYSFRPKVNKGKTKKYRDRVNDPGGDGFETIKEIKVCPKCHENFTKELSDEKC